MSTVSVKKLRNNRNKKGVTCQMDNSVDLDDSEVQNVLFCDIADETLEFAATTTAPQG